MPQSIKMSQENNDPKFTMIKNQEHVFTILIFTITTLVGIPGNLMVLWVTGMRMKKTVTTVWYRNLALADIICCLVFPFIIPLFIYGKWIYGGTLCKILPSVHILNMFASVFTLMAISIDRCILVVRPVWAQNHRNLWMARMICVAIWVLSFLMCLPGVLYRRIFTENNTTQCGYGREIYNNESNISDQMHVTYPKATVHFTRTIFGFLIPFCIIFVSYAYLSNKLKNSRLLKVQQKTTKVVFVIIIAFCVTWAPYHIMSVIVLYTEKNRVVAYLVLLSRALATFNSCMNPVIYVFMGKDGKSRVRHSIRRVMENAFAEEVSKRTNPSGTRISTDESANSVV
ncbi:C3a anaphylatoxin chemotactic receptor-like isoform X2 [Hyperolius riggenbachi]|uniref:C3a anaphylatoxin chemotactic receptor-like isoform X2 n=1 Tax=Hyperolius riggenbachi TaxID=752182 RepID=UPI0035A2F239